MWGLEPEIDRWNEVRAKFKNLTDAEVSEIVLSEDWPAKLRREMESENCDDAA
jgi:hypothetical protein